MRDLALDPLTGDLDTSGGNLHHVTGLAAIRQRVWVRLRLFLGEWFLNNSLGVDYYGQVLVHNPDLGAIEALLRSVIVESEGVLRLSSYSQTWQRDERRLMVSFVAETDEGLLDVEGPLP